MSDLRDIMAYLIKASKLRGREEPSTARLTKMVYLSDWKAAIVYGHQLTNIRWYFDSYGPFVWDVHDMAKSNPDLFEIEETTTPLGSPKRVFRLRNEHYTPKLSQDEEGILEHVVNSTYDLNWQSFMKLVYSTYPVLSSDRFNSLNLVDKAKQYSQNRAK